MAEDKPITPQDMRALAERLRNRANSVLMNDQRQQASDLRTAAVLVETLAALREH